MVWVFCLTAAVSFASQSERSQRASENPALMYAHYLETPVSQLLPLLDDPLARVTPQFHIPQPLKPMVSLWFQIYAKYSLYQTLIYDRVHPDLVYEIIDTREFFKKGLSPVRMDLLAKARVRKALANFHQAFKRLAQNPRAKFKDGTSGFVLSKLYGRKSSSEWRRIESQMRIQPGQRDRIMEGILAADPFLPAMEAIFKKYGLPPELTRIPLVESSFNLNAVSKVKAVGVWQFMEKSAREYLVVDKYHKIDERISPIKSAYAAARMFKRNVKILGDYGLAIIAYNHGLKNLIRVKRKYKGANIAKLLTEKRSPLGYASRNYYAEFLAILFVERYRDQLYNIPLRNYSDAISIVRLKKPTSIFELSSLYNISLYELKNYNPDIFDYKRQLPVGTRIVVPRKLGESLVALPQSDREPASSVLEFIEYIQ